MEQNLLNNIALTMVPDVGPVIAKLLISYCGSAEAVFKASKRELLKIPGVGQKTVEKLISSNTFGRAEVQLKFLSNNNGKAVVFHSDEYPQRLKHFDSSPLVLYLKGEMNLNHKRTVAIIGTRKPTEQGKINCEKLIEGLQDYGVQIISGLAFGIDTCAHKKCVETNTETIGIMGHGLDILYPAENRKLVSKMIKNGGVLTEFPTNTRPDRENFPMRNRIIASMSDVIVVVESKRKGGSIITAEFANNYNKDVFAIPGRTTDEVSEGCNKLIKQHKANLLESAADISYIMRWDETDKSRVVQKALFIDFNDEEQKLIDILKEKDSVTVDEFSHLLKLPPSNLANMLLTLEFKGAIRSLPGKKYILS
ncbi:MAG: DNA processing protein [Saprospiraceae bacterium]|jgi:DNA processing protein|tara:strand:- start:296 stop:1393 length:1098 start_codon:yes stop_codon:yes gene_type:complete